MLYVIYCENSYLALTDIPPCTTTASDILDGFMCMEAYVETKEYMTKLDASKIIAGTNPAQYQLSEHVICYEVLKAGFKNMICKTENILLSEGRIIENIRVFVSGHIAYPKDCPIKLGGYQKPLLVELYDSSILMKS